MLVNPPDKLKKLSQLRRFCNELRAFAIATQPLKGLGTTVSESMEGIAINAGPGMGGSGLYTPLLAVKVNNTTIRVVYGTVGGLDDPFSAGDDPITTLTVSGTGYVYFNLTVSGGSPSTLAFSSGASVPSDTATNAYRAVCSYATDGGGVLSVAPNLTGSQNYQNCADVHQFWT